MKNETRSTAGAAASFCAALLLFGGCSRPAAKPAPRPQPPPATVVREAPKPPPVPVPAPVGPPAVSKPVEVRLTLGRMLLITGNAGDDAQPILAQAGKTLDDVEQFLKFPPSSAPVTLRLFDTHSAMREWMAAASLGKSDSDAASFRTAQGAVIVLVRQKSAQETSRLARCGVARVAVMERFPEAPAWTRDGLARYFENGVPYDRPNAAALKLIQGEGEDGAEGALSDLVSAPAGKPLDSKSVARAWALTHFLVTQTEDGPAALRTYLDQARAGKQAVEAFTGAFGVAPDELEPAWRLHLARLEASAKDGN